MARQIVVGCDESDDAEAALEVAITAAKELGDRLVLVFGYEPPGGRWAKSSGNTAGRSKNTGPPSPAGAREGPGRRDRDRDHPRRQGPRRRAGRRGTGARGMIPGSTPRKLLHISETPVLLCVRG